MESIQLKKKQSIIQLKVRIFTDQCLILHRVIYTEQMHIRPPKRKITKYRIKQTNVC